MIATIILICLASAKFFTALVNDGKEKEPSIYKAKISIVVLAIELALFYHAGLFDKLMH